MSSDEEYENGALVLSDLVNRVLDKGVVISGHVTISIADIDLLEVDLKLLLTSIETATKRGMLVDHSRNADAPLLPPASDK